MLKKQLVSLDDVGKETRRLSECQSGDMVKIEKLCREVDLIKRALESVGNILGKTGSKVKVLAEGMDSLRNENKQLRDEHGRSKNDMLTMVRRNSMRMTVELQNVMDILDNFKYFAFGFVIVIVLALICIILIICQ